MPLFFMISGTLSTKLTDVELLGYIKKKFRTLILPYFTFSIIGGFINGLDVFPSYFLGSIKGGLWFLPCLFVFSVMLIVICKVSRRLNYIKKTHSDILLIIVTAFLLGVLYLLIPDSMQDIFIPGTLLLYWPYYALGYIISCYSFSLSDRIIALLGIIFIVVWWCDFSSHVYGKPVYQFSRLCAVLFFYYIFQNTRFVVKVLSFIGRETLCIYLMHYYFIKGIYGFVFHKCGDVPLFEICSIIFVSIVISYICIIIKRMLNTNRYLGFLLFGQKL